MPGDYDHSNPSGEGRLVYDKQGNPAKAEYGTAVYDLAVGKFQGVPPQASLQEAIEASAARAQANRNPTPKAVLQFEDRIRSDALETVGLFDAQGSLIYRNQGKADRVEIHLNESQQRRVKDSFMTHNHPTEKGVRRGDPRWRGYSFSVEDIEAAAELEVAEIRVVTRGYRHSMRPPKSGWNKELSENIRLAFEKNRAKVLSEMRSAIARGELTIEQAQADEFHETWQRTSKQLRLKYKREKK